jgi:hypothetical protein
MPVRINLTLYEANPERATITVVQEDNNLPVDLTGGLIEVFVKPTATTADADGSVVKLSTTAGSVLISSPATAGIAVIIFPSTLSSGTKWWRADVVISGQRKTCAFGSLTVENT